MWATNNEGPPTIQWKDEYDKEATYKLAHINHD